MDSFPGLRNFLNVSVLYLSFLVFSWDTLKHSMICSNSRHFDFDHSPHSSGAQGEASGLRHAGQALRSLALLLHAALRVTVLLHMPLLLWCVHFYMLWNISLSCVTFAYAVEYFLMM